MAEILELDVLLRPFQPKPFKDFMILWSFMQMKRPNPNKANRQTANCRQYGLINYTSGKLTESHIYIYALQTWSDSVLREVEYSCSRNFMFTNLTARISSLLMQPIESRLKMTCMKGVTTYLSQTTHDPESCTLTLKEAILPACYRTWKLLMQSNRRGLQLLWHVVGCWWSKRHTTSKETACDMLFPPLEVGPCVR